MTAVERQDYTFAPVVEWDADLAQCFRAAIGEDRFDRLAATLARPPLQTCLRVNTMCISPEAALDKVLEEVQAQVGSAVNAFVHPRLACAIIVQGSGPHVVHYSEVGSKVVVIARKAGEAVLRGAEVFAPGVLACSAGVAAGDKVAVLVRLEHGARGRAGICRGTTLADDTASRALVHASRHVCLGVGRMAMGRVELFRRSSGLAVALEQRVYRVPSLNGKLEGAVCLQNLPSIVAALVLKPRPGSRVLDMCAAPGGKTTLLAQLMEDKGQVVALDRSHAKVDEILAYAREQGFTCISAFKQDSTKLLRAPKSRTAAACPQAWLVSDAPGCGSASQTGTAYTAGSASGEVEPSTAAPALVGRAPGQGPSRPLVGASCDGAAVEPSATTNMAQTSGSCGDTGTTGPCRHEASAKALARHQRRCAAMRARGITPPVSELRAAGLLSEARPMCSGFEPESFPYVLLDAPCTGTGLRPCLYQPLTLKEVESTARYQRQLLDAAVRVLAVGGSLVYSTCSVTPQENESNVAYVLRTYACMQLSPQEPRLGAPGQPGFGTELSPWHLSEEEAALVQRFDPSDGNDDCIGFFVAKFTKLCSWDVAPASL